MSLSKTFNIPIYGCTIKMHIVKDIKRKYRAICKASGLESGDIGDPGALFLTAEPHTYHMIFREDLVTHYFISHECYHTVKRILKDRDIKDEESGAYLMGYLSQEVMNTLKAKNIKVG